MALPPTKAKTFTEIHVFRHLWGTELQGEPLHRLIPRIRALGYHGIEASLQDIHEPPLQSLATPSTLSLVGFEPFIDLLKENGNMPFICGVYTGWVDYAPGGWDLGVIGVQDHIRNYREQLQIAKALNPLHINSHSGCDMWTMDEHVQFFEAALQIEKEMGLSVSHETHRSRSLYTPSVTLELVRRFPDLKLTLDFSHWVLVAERLLDHPSDEKWLAEIIPRVRHIHGRIGSVQAPQLSHPFAPEFNDIVDRYYSLWTSVWKSQQESGKTFTTITPEYGPAPYTPCLPFTGMPVSDVWEVCNSEKDRIISRFNDFIQQK